MIRTKNVGGFCIFLLTLFLLCFGIFVVNKFCILYWFHEPNTHSRILSVLPTTTIGTVLFVIFNSFGYLSTVSHLRASFWDPGIITKDIKAPSDMSEEQIRKCKRCKDIWKPTRAHHCSECNVCIYKMDHHCPWINSWVGIKNSKYFFLFTFYTGIGALLSIAIIITSFILLMQEDSNIHIKKRGYPIAFFLWICVFIESILFSFFTLELVGEQIEAFQDNQTYIDDLKDLVGVPLTLTQGFKTAIGEDWLFWGLPTKPVLYINYSEKLYRVQEIINKKHYENPSEDYDPSGKLKAIAVQEAKTDKIYFAVFSCLMATTWYYLSL